MKYSREQISFNPTRYVLEVGKRGLDLSEGMRAHLGLKDVDDLKRKYASEYVDRLLGHCERIAFYRIPAYFWAARPLTADLNLSTSSICLCFRSKPTPKEYLIRALESSSLNSA
jgi:hypothetical protein